MYDRERVTNNRGLTVTSQRKFVMFYESLWRDVWNIQGNLGPVPGEPINMNTSKKRFVVPEQPTCRVLGIEVLNLPPDLLKHIRVKIMKGTNFTPELRFDSGKSKNDPYKTTFPCDCEIQGNFKVSIECKKGMFGSTAKVLELWHNTLFMDW